jgi:hypothetical protein
MRLPIAGLALVMTLGAMTSSAQAQTPQQSTINNAAKLGEHAAATNGKGATDETKVKANDKAYNAALKNLPDKQYDPWRGVR